MSDDTKPRRVRGQKEREAAFRAGFLAGLGYALSEVKTQQAVQDAREHAMRSGWAQVCAFDTPKRTRRKKGENGPMRLPHPGDAQEGL